MEKLEYQKIIMILILAISFASCCSKKEIVIQYYNSNTVVDAEDKFKDTLAIWTTNLSRSLNLKYRFKAGKVDTWSSSGRFDYHPTKIPVRFVSGSTPSYNGTNHAINIPISMENDPVILLHELIHYITDTNRHLRGNNTDSEYIYDECKVLYNGCLNILASERQTSKPFTFLFTEEQSKDINSRRKEECADCEEGAIYHKFPSILIKENNIEEVVDCCDFENVPIDTIKSFYIKIKERPLTPSELDEIEKLANATLNRLKNNGICPYDISVETNNQIQTVIFELTTNNSTSVSTRTRGPNHNIFHQLKDSLYNFISFYEPLNNKRTKDALHNSALELIKLIRYWNGKRKEIDKQFKEESIYLSEILGVPKERIYQIRKRGYNYIQQFEFDKAADEINGS